MFTIEPFRETSPRVLAKIPIGLFLYIPLILLWLAAFAFGGYLLSKAMANPNNNSFITSISSYASVDFAYSILGYTGSISASFFFHLFTYVYLFSSRRLPDMMGLGCGIISTIILILLVFFPNSTEPGIFIHGNYGPVFFILTQLYTVYFYFKEDFNGCICCKNRFFMIAYYLLIDVGYYLYPAPYFELFEWYAAIVNFFFLVSMYTSVENRYLVIHYIGLRSVFSYNTSPYSTQHAKNEGKVARKRANRKREERASDTEDEDMESGRTSDRESDDSSDEFEKIPDKFVSGKTLLNITATFIFVGIAAVFATSLLDLGSDPTGWGKKLSELATYPYTYYTFAIINTMMFSNVFLIFLIMFLLSRQRLVDLVAFVISIYLCLSLSGLSVVSTSYTNPTKAWLHNVIAQSFALALIPYGLWIIIYYRRQSDMLFFVRCVLILMFVALSIAFSVMNFIGIERIGLVEFGAVLLVPFFMISLTPEFGKIAIYLEYEETVLPL